MEVYSLLIHIITLISVIISVSAWGSSDKVRLEDVKVLTLYPNLMTKGRRSSPIPQLKCTGGTAGCSSISPQAIQCHNRGSDGVDVQWECTTDMDKRFKFGRVEVSCEGYEYPDDPYILKGSCGLEYSVDYTSGQGGGSSWFGGGNQNTQSQYQKKSGAGFGDILMLVIIGLVIYYIYRSVSRQNTEGNNDYSTTNDDYPGGYPGNPGGRGYPGNQPPPPGFRPEYMPGDAGGCGANRRNAGGAGAGGGFGGFWTGAAAGGLMGYLMGNNNNRGHMYNRPYSGGNSGFFGGGGSGFGGGGASMGSRTASGFGGTRRR